MFVVAVTGGLGAGKSEAARILGERGAVVLDLDEMAKEVLDEDPVVREAIVAAFGEGVLGSDGRVVRSRLADEGFRCQATATTLGAVVHPGVIRRATATIRELESSESPPVAVVLEVPLLVEAPALLSLFDLVVALEAPVAVRLERVVARGMSSDDALRRMALQVDDEARREVADVVIVNDTGVDALSESLGRVWEDHVEPRKGGPSAG